MHGIIRRRQAIQILIPGRRTREQQLDGDPDQVDVSEGARKDWKRGGRCKEEDEDGADEGAAKVDDAVGEACEDVENDVFVRGKNVA